MTIEPYLAVAVQARAQAVEALPDVASARAAMRGAIEALEADLRGAKAFLEKFHGLPLKLAVLPEYCFSGFETGRVADFADRAAFAPDGPEYAALGEIARRLDLFLAGNAYETDQHFPGLHFQTSFLVDPEGEVVLRYRRLHSMFTPSPHDVWSEYRRHYSLEEVFPVADTAIGRLAAIASEEILFPEVARAHALRGAELFLHSSSEAGGLVPTAKHVARRARALENLAYVVSANTAGIAEGGLAGLSADGNSAIIDYRGRVLAEALSGSNVNACAEVDIEALRRHRRRTGMSNLLSRLRTEPFRETYAQPVHPADQLLCDGKPRMPERSFFPDALAAIISARARKGYI
ncbi:nitrilase-related carbon-nitrogen hydrolase [Thermaurantiacus sp.]